MSVASERSEAVEETTPASVDVVVVGAGFSGLYAIHRMRKAGFDVLCFEAGDGVGGTWYWNRYPGARVDIESVQYSYAFDEDLQQDWKWPELFSPQGDLEDYINHVADRFDLRRSIRFNARVDSVVFDEEERRWQVGTEAGHRVRAKYVIAATGPLDATNVPSFPGIDTFEGELHHTSQWPREGVDLRGKRVGVIGTGSTGVQVVPEVAKVAGHLHVFQRTPAYTVPAHNRALDPDYEREWKENYAQRREMMRHHPNALVLPMTQHGSVFDHTPEERLAILEEAWRSRSGLLFFFLFNDVLTDIRANEVVAEWFRGKIREIVKDPEVAELLCPTTYPLGSKRLSIDSGYYDTFNRDNVTLVDVRRDPIVELTPKGIRTEEAEYDLDVLILATGFDAMTGSLLRLNVVGAGGVPLREKWSGTPWNYLGLMVSGFPNMFLVHGPGSPSVLAQMVTQSEYQIDWIADLLSHMEQEGLETVDTTTEAERTWCAEVTELANGTLFPLADSWQKGANIEGKPQSYMIWVGGFDAFADRCDQVAAAGYDGFVLKP
ncbi:NAD(P)/FAD-dependent oxidoreductase [Pseudonocardia kujensis]|uniref:flavin-containing monooxygenase n=1 Tax=Pseudonocardia kujensis TaxID=1128675 RepID=UPI001E2FC5B1|nr:NAD(P)/FAD-dependent oxidoreductase [Pseudonocardia kujensis]MCE0767605.1 NAD(P)/FAD-dependent oxidoreductase [Pseudonocardia kujensis]